MEILYLFEKLQMDGDEWKDKDPEIGGMVVVGTACEQQKFYESIMKKNMEDFENGVSPVVVKDFMTLRTGAGI